MPRKSTVSSLKRTADAVFSELVRRLACSGPEHLPMNDSCQCITCKEWFHWKEVDCGHYLGRRYNGTRYDRRNTAPQCRHCNRGESGRIYEYGKYLVSIYGEEIIEELRTLAHSKKRFTIDELKEMIVGWRKELQELTD